MSPRHDTRSACDRDCDRADSCVAAVRSARVVGIRERCRSRDRVAGVRAACDRDRGGFTTLELILVVAIAVIAAALAIALFSGAGHSADEAIDQANARALCSDISTRYRKNDCQPLPASQLKGQFGVELDKATNTFRLYNGSDYTSLRNNSTVTVTYGDGGYTVTLRCGSDGNIASWTTADTSE